MMKCRHENIFVSFLVIIICVSAEERQIINRNPFFRDKLLPNTLENEDYSDLTHHKIVKKQMALTTDTYVLRDNGKGTQDHSYAFSGGANAREKMSYRNRKSDGLNNNYKIFLRNKHLGKIKKTNQMIAEGRLEFVSQGSNRQSSRISKRSFNFDNAISESADGNGRSCVCRAAKRVPDSNHCSSYLKWEINPIDCAKFGCAKCQSYCQSLDKDGLCLTLAFSNAMERPVRQLTCYCPRKPEPGPENDSEPSNEWLDAPQGNGPKIPSEFKPKPKLKLKIYHLRCKRTPNKLGIRSSHIKRSSLSKLNDPDSLQSKIKEHIGRPNVRRHYPRSFVVRLKEKETIEDDRLNSKTENESDEEEDDEDDEDEYEETEEETEETPTNNNVNEEDKPNQKEGLKDLFKSAKDPVINKVKNTESTSPQKFETKVTYNPRNAESPAKEPEKPNKVLIDARIRVDEEISSLLKNMLSKGSRKSSRKIP